MENMQCIICLDHLDVYTIHDFILKQPILKSCECVYSIHESCIIEWIRNNPTCPYCKEQLYLEHNLHSTDIIPINGTSEGQSISIINDNMIIHIENENTPLIYVTEIKHNYCIRIVLISVCIIMFILLIGNIIIY
jgi:hypothetical protein